MEYNLRAIIIVASILDEKIFLAISQIFLLFSNETSLLSDDFGMLSSVVIGMQYSCSF